MVTSMYTGAEKNDQTASDTDKYITSLSLHLSTRSPLAYMENMERIKLLFAKVNRTAFPYEIEALIKYFSKQCHDWLS